METHGSLPEDRTLRMQFWAGTEGLSPATSPPGEVCSSRIAEARSSQGPAGKWEPKAEEGEVPAPPWLSLLDPRRT